MSAADYDLAPDLPALPTPKPREVTVAFEWGDQAKMVISRSPRQRWIDMCWQLLGMQRDIAQRQVHGPGTTKFR